MEEGTHKHQHASMFKTLNNFINQLLFEYIEHK